MVGPGLIHGCGPLELLGLVQRYVESLADVLPRASHDLSARSYELLELTDDLEIWAIHWPRDQGLELHDHGGSSGALWVVDGALQEHSLARGGGLIHRTLEVGGGSAFGPSHIHDVVNIGDCAGHQCPRLLSAHGVDDLLPPGRTGTGGRTGRVPGRSGMGPVSGVDRLLADARQLLRRVDAEQARQILRRRWLVDRHPPGRPTSPVR